LDQSLKDHNRAHHGHRVGGLRAAVLGANDGIVSTASLIIGVASANGTRAAVLVAGAAGLIAGALSMAAGEYVSVHSQADSDSADLDVERRYLSSEPDLELDELAAIYEGRGLDPELASIVAKKLTEQDALAAHARDELGISERNVSNPLQAAAFSAASFAIGAFLPLAAVWFTASPQIPLIAAASLIFLSLLGAIAAKAGGANMVRGSLRVLVWGAVAMAATALVGHLFGTNV